MPKSTHYLQDSKVPITNDTSYELFMMQDKTRDPILITLQVNQVPVEMELDTVVSLTLINRATYSKITCDSPVTLEHSNAQLQIYTGQPVAILGTVTIQAKYGEQLLQLPVHVVEGDGPILLGRDWLGKLLYQLLKRGTCWF